MLKFPKIKSPNYPLKEIIRDTSIKGEVENQTIISRKRFTRTPMQFELKWNALNHDDYEKLKSFYEQVNGGVPFLWEYPFKKGHFKGKEYKVRFASDFDFDYHNFNMWQGTLKLEEV